MKIIFTKHFKERKLERNDYLVPVNQPSELQENMPRLESILRNKGNWYVNYETKDTIPRTYCIVNNLEVYCGLIVENDPDLEIVITTYYPYSKKLKKRLFPRGRPNFERMDATSITLDPEVKICLQ